MAPRKNDNKLEDFEIEYVDRTASTKVTYNWDYIKKDIREQVREYLTAAGDEANDGYYVFEIEDGIDFEEVSNGTV